MILRDLILREFNKTFVPVGFSVNIESLNYFCSSITYTLSNIVIVVNVDEREDYFYYEIDKTNENDWNKIVSPNRLNENNILNYVETDVRKKYQEETKRYKKRKWIMFNTNSSLESYVVANRKLLDAALPKIINL